MTRWTVRWLVCMALTACAARPPAEHPYLTQYYQGREVGDGPMLAWVSRSDSHGWRWWPGHSGECVPVRFRWTSGYELRSLPDDPSVPFLTWVGLADPRPRWRGSFRQKYTAPLRLASAGLVGERERQLWDAAPWSVGAEPIEPESLRDGDVVWAYIVHSAGMPMIPALSAFDMERSELTRVVVEPDASLAPGERRADGWVAVRRHSLEVHRVLRRNCGAFAGGQSVTEWTVVVESSMGTEPSHPSGGTE